MQICAPALELGSFGSFAGSSYLCMRLCQTLGHLWLQALPGPVIPPLLSHFLEAGWPGPQFTTHCNPLCLLPNLSATSGDWHHALAPFKGTIHGAQDCGDQPPEGPTTLSFHRLSSIGPFLTGS